MVMSEQMYLCESALMHVLPVRSMICGHLSGMRRYWMRKLKIAGRTWAKSPRLCGLNSVLPLNSDCVFWNETHLRASPKNLRKGVPVSSGVPGGGAWGRVQVGGGMVFLWKMREKGKEWGGWGVAASQCARVCQNYSLPNYPLVSPGDESEAGSLLPDRKDYQLDSFNSILSIVQVMQSHRHVGVGLGLPVRLGCLSVHCRGGSAAASQAPFATQN